MATVSDKLHKVNEHSLPYRVLMEELRVRRPEKIPAVVDALLDAVDEAHSKVAEYERRPNPDLNQYRALQEQCVEKEKPLKDILHDASLNALCFSGGGIRSASFGLGVLTGLAELSVAGASGKKPVMEEIDYVSTVSGGGYLGSWLTGWIRKHPRGFRGVLSDLAMFRLTSADPEAAPVRHLRDYTSYLAPSGGLFSPDMWTLAAIFLRNLLLNWAILIPTFAALIVLPVLDTYAFSWARKLDATALLYAAAGLACCALFFAGLDLPGNFLQQPAKSWKTSFAWSGIPLLLSAWCLSNGFLAAHDANPKFDPPFLRLWYMSLIAHAGLFVARFAMSKWKAGRASGESAGDLLGQTVALVGSSLFAAWILWLFAVHVGPSLVKTGADVRLFSSVAVPLILGAFSLTGVLLNGLSAKFDLEEDREWWSRAAAYVLMGLVVWPVVHLLVLFNREISDAAGAVFFHKVGGDTSIPALAGIIGALASWIGFTPRTASAHAKVDTKKLGGIAQALSSRDLLIPALGVTFFVFLGIALAEANDWLARWMSGTKDPSAIPLRDIAIEFAFAFGLAVVMNLFVNVNTFSLHAMYRSRLVRSYLGASNNERRPNSFTNFDANDNFPLADAPQKDAPLHIVNITLNVVATKKLAWQQRKAESFTASALHCGSFRVGYRPTATYGGTRGVTLGTAMAISGAAASPNMGYHSSPILTLVMTFFNARLGWWLPNPGPHGEGLWKKTSPGLSLQPLLNEALGKTTDENRWVYLSDGGHFENLGLYEMVLRRCKNVIVVDGGADPDFALEDLGNAVRKIQIDLGIPITFDPPVALTRGPDSKNHHCFAGRIRYSHMDLDRNQLDRLCKLEDPSFRNTIQQKRFQELAGNRNRSAEEEKEYLQLAALKIRSSAEEKEYQELSSLDGTLVYLKASLNGNEPADVTQYAKTHPDFPHESTANQFFNESQFESYMRLGMHVVEEIMWPRAARVPTLPAVTSTRSVSMQEFVDAAK